MKGNNNSNKMKFISLFSGERHMRCQTNNYSAML